MLGFHYFKFYIFIHEYTYLTCTTPLIESGSTPIEYFITLNNDRETNAIFGSNTCSSFDNTYDPKVTKDT